MCSSLVFEDVREEPARHIVAERFAARDAFLSAIPGSAEVVDARA